MTYSLESTLTLNNGVAMPRFGLGVFRAEAGSEAENAVRWALEAGYRHIDTAAIYGNETEVGQSVRAGIVPREDVFVTSKIWPSDFGYDSARKALDASLERLGFDYLDLYLIHWPSGDWQNTWRAMQDLYKEGRIKSIGVSNFLVHHLKELLDFAEIVPAANQFEFHPYLQQPALQAFCHENNIAITAWAPIMKGRVLDVPTLVEIGEKYGKSAVHVTLRWMLQKDIIAIPKSAKQARIIDNADIYNFELTDDELAAIDALDKGERIGPHPDTFGQ